jgi:hypothetical protein
MTKIQMARIRNGKVMRIKGLVGAIKALASTYTTPEESIYLCNAAYIATKVLPTWSKNTKHFTSKCTSTHKPRSKPHAHK